MSYSYEIKPRPAELSGGWKLALQDGQEVDGGVFPVLENDPQAGMDWWNRCSEQERGRWLEAVGSARPADAYYAFLTVEAHADAESAAYDWLDSRNEGDRE
jgi:hypothetical protein